MAVREVLLDEEVVGETWKRRPEPRSVLGSGLSPRQRDPQCKGLAVESVRCVQGTARARGPSVQAGVTSVYDSPQMAPFLVPCHPFLTFPSRQFLLSLL